VFDNFQGKRIPFVKASACGNDFLIIDGRYASEDPSELSRRLCDRHNGVGADGVEWLYRDEQRDGVIHLINADGSKAEISGNGTRCVAAYLAVQTGKTRLVIGTDAGDRLCDLRRRENARFYFRTEMGTPHVGDDFALKLRRGTVRGTPVSTGNPHYVIFVNEFPHEWQVLAEEIQRQEQAFQDGVNVEFVTVTGPSEIAIRIYERGAGETQSSGTGTSATASAAIAAGKVQGPAVTVVSPGGAQTVEWAGGNTALALEGPADLLCKGEFFA
jgi:diaminopimelate epimerase